MSFGPFFNVGTDQSVTITNATGGAVTLDGKRSMMEMQAADSVIKSEPIDNGGIPDHRVIADGWTGTIEVEKQSDNFGALAAFLDANYYAGGAQQYFTITETIRTPDGSGSSRYQYSNCVFHGYKPGSWSKKQIVKARVEVAAAQRIQL